MRGRPSGWSPSRTPNAASASAGSTSTASSGRCTSAAASGPRGADADRRQLAGAGREGVLHRHGGGAAGRRAPAPLPHRRAAGCSTSTTSRSTAPPATSSTASRTSCSRSSERSRDERMRDIVATIQADQYRLITRRAGGRPRHPGRPRNRQDGGRACTGRPGCSTPTARELERSGVLRRRAEPRLHGLHLPCACPTLGEERVEQRGGGRAGRRHRRRSAPKRAEAARLKGDARLAEVIAAAVRALPRRPDRAARRSASRVWSCGCRRRRSTGSIDDAASRVDRPRRRSRAPAR